jgi:3-hydroxyisobutyrate dehydrogenase
MNDKKIAFIGLGNMGGPMAANLVKAGFKVKGFDLSKQAQMAASRSGSVCLNSRLAAAKWISAMVMLQPRLAAAQ